jgi:hypothetical protein
MSEKLSTYAGLACAALVLAGLVPGISDAATGIDAGRQPVTASAAAGKGDLLAAPRPVARHEVASIRMDGGNAALSMRTRAGTVVYEADGTAGLSVAAKNVVLPPAPEPMKEVAPPAAAPQAPVAQNAIKAEPRKMPIGCERLVSVLVKSAERDRLGRCLA